MKKYMLKALVLVAMLIIADQSIGYGLKWMYSHQQGGDYGCATKAIMEQEADVLILGSSRARHHYNPAILSDSLKMSVYNAGRDGCFLVYQWAQLKLILDRYTPKIVLLEVTPYDFNLNPSDYDRLSGLLPYQDCPSFKEVIHKKSPWEEWKCLSGIYPYNGQILSMITSMNAKVADMNEGFDPLQGSIYHQMETGNGGAIDQLDEEKVNLMYEIIELCKEKGIELFMITSPYYIHFTYSETLNRVQAICAERHIPYVSYLNNPEYSDGKLYQTADHLNAEGADIFSRSVAEWILSNMK